MTRKEIELEPDRSYVFKPDKIEFLWDNDIAWIKKDELDTFIKNAKEYYA